MKTRIITAIVGILVLIGVLFTFDTLVFNFVIAAITLIAIHEVFKALGFGRKEWPMYAVFVPYTLLIMLSSYQVWRRLVMPASFLMVLFFGIYLVVRNAQVDFAKASGLVMFSGIVIFCFYSFIRLKELLPVETYGYDAMFFILLILCFAWGGDTCAYFAGRAFGKHKLCPVVSPKKTVEGAIGGVLGTMVFGVIATVIYSIAANRMEAFTRTNIGVSMYVIIALLACVAAVLGIYGDLFASVVKRQCGIKDYGTIFPGHGGDCRVGDEGEVVAEHGSAHDGGDAERQRKAGGLGNSSGDRHEKRDRSDGGSHGRRDEAGNDKEHSDGILCRNPGEHEIGNALCTAPSDNADKRACGEEDQQHCDDVFVPDALSHEGELFFKRDTAVLQTGDEDRCQKRDDDGDVVEAHRNF